MAASRSGASRETTRFRYGYGAARRSTGARTTMRTRRRHVLSGERPTRQVKNLLLLSQLPFLDNRNFFYFQAFHFARKAVSLSVQELEELLDALEDAFLASLGMDRNEKAILTSATNLICCDHVRPLVYFCRCRDF